MNKLFQVKLMANLPRSDMPGYRQWYDVYHNCDWVGTHNNDPTLTVPGDPQLSEEAEHVVLMAEVLAASMIAAVRRFQKWQSNGSPMKDLLTEGA